MKESGDGGSIIVDGRQIPFTVTRSRKRRRTVAFKMQADGTLVVMAPHAASTRALQKLAQQNAAWVARKLTERAKGPPRCAFTDGAVLPYLGHACVLRVTMGEEQPSSCALSRRRWRVHVRDAALSDEARAAETRLELQLWLKKRARSLLKKRLDLWAARMGLPYRRFVLAGAEHRWGSCSADNVIRLNWRLMLSPMPLLDYVVVHELAHVRHKDHSPRFWGLVAAFIPDWRARRKRLRTYETNLDF